MQTIYLDISNKGVIPTIQAKQSEVGRKFLAVITDNGVPYNIPDNSLLSVWYEGNTDAGNYSSIDEKSAFSIDANKVTVELVAQMLLKPGKGDLCLSVTHGDGGETNTWNIPYEVEYKPGAGSDVPTEYYTALTEASAIAAEQVALAKNQADAAKQYAEQIKNLMTESKEYPGCYYRMAGGEKEWLNPPMVMGIEYRTTERFLGKPVYTKLVDFGTLPNATNKNVAHATSVDQNIIYLQGILSNGAPFSTGYNQSRSDPIVKFWVDATKWNIRILTEGDMSTVTATVLVKYTKV